MRPGVARSWTRSGLNYRWIIRRNCAYGHLSCKHSENLISLLDRFVDAVHFCHWTVWWVGTETAVTGGSDSNTGRLIIASRFTLAHWHISMFRVTSILRRLSCMWASRFIAPVVVCIQWTSVCLKTPTQTTEAKSLFGVGLGKINEP